jgi:hypothetical protein
VVLFSADGSGRYNQASWKAHLARAYGATGAALTSALRAQGHDAVVTAVALRGDLVSSEIVILDPAAVAWRPPC